MFLEIGLRFPSYKYVTQVPACQHALAPLKSISEVRKQNLSITAFQNVETDLSFSFSLIFKQKKTKLHPHYYASFFGPPLLNFLKPLAGEGGGRQTKSQDFSTAGGISKFLNMSLC